MSRSMSEVLKVIKTFVLKDSKEYAKYPQKRYQICNAACRAAVMDLISWEEANAVTLLMRERLGNYVTVEDWLRNNCFLKELMSSCAEEVDQMQMYRHRWLDALIKEFS